MAKESHITWRNVSGAGIEWRNADPIEWREAPRRGLFSRAMEYGVLRMGSALLAVVMLLAGLVTLVGPATNIRQSLAGADDGIYSRSIFTLHEDSPRMLFGPGPPPPGAVLLGTNTVPDTADAAGYPMCWALIGLGLLLLNATFRRAQPTGPVDRLFGSLAGNRMQRVLVPLAIVFLVSLAWLAGKSVRATFYSDEVAAVRALKADIQDAAEVKRTISSTDAIFFWKGASGRMSYTPVSPDLIRALRSEGLEIRHETPKHEYPVPGFMPFIVLLVLAAWAHMAGSARIRDRQEALGAIVGIYLFVLLYLLVWCTTAQFTSIYATGDIKENWAAVKILLTLGWFWWGFGVYRRAMDNGIPASSAMLWIGFYTGMALVAILGAPLLGVSSPGAPVGFWLLALLACVSLFLWSLGRALRAMEARP